MDFVQLLVKMEGKHHSFAFLDRPLFLRYPLRIQGIVVEHACYRILMAEFLLYLAVVDRVNPYIRNVVVEAGLFLKLN